MRMMAKVARTVQEGVKQTLRLTGRAFSDNEWERIAARSHIRAMAEMPFLEAAHLTYLRRLELRPTDRKPRIIVSLTSIPPRLYGLHLVIRSILRQSVLPDRIILWLSQKHRRRHLGKISPSALPDSLRKWQRRGLEIRWTEDIGSYRKLLPTLKQFPEDIVITIDDDTYYPRNAIQSLYQAWQQHGNGYVYCRRSRILEQRQVDGAAHWVANQLNFSSTKNDQNLFSVGAGGVLYPPGTFSPEFFNEKAMTELVPYEDDCWFNMMARLNGRSIFQVDAEEIMLLPHHRHQTLAGITKGKGRQEFNRQLTGLIRHYKIDL